MHPMVPQPEPKRSWATNKLTVYHVAPPLDTYEGPGNVASGIIVTCQGQFESKLVEILYTRHRNATFRNWIEQSNCHAWVLPLGPEGSPMRINDFQKKGILWFTEPGEDIPTGVATQEQVKNFVMTYIVPSVQAINPVNPGREPMWDDSTTCVRMAAFDEILNNHWIADTIFRHFVVNHQEYPQYVNSRDFWHYSQKNLYSFYTPGRISHAFKVSAGLTNENMLPVDHHVDVPHAHLALEDNDAPQNGHQNGQPNDQPPQDVLRPVNLAIVMPLVDPNLAPGDDNNDAPEVQQGNNNGNDDPLQDDPIEESDEEEEADQRPPPRRRRN